MKIINHENLNISIALIWTKYQYHILLALLRTMNIEKSSVLLIVYTKAKHNDVQGKGFYKTIYYSSEENASIDKWFRVKRDIISLIESLGIYPKNLFLRNYDSAIGRILLSQYKNTPTYLLEDGAASYIQRNYLGYPQRFKEILKNILLRFYFSTDLLKFLPLIRKNTLKSGLFFSVDPWLNVPFVPVTLSKEDIFEKDIASNESPQKYKILILEQPLWQAGFDDNDLIHAYKKMSRYIFKHFKLGEGPIGIKMHPSSNRKRVEEILKKADLDKDIEVLDTQSNLEEMIFSGELSSVQQIIGFYSSGLYLAKALLKENNIEIIAFSTKKLEDRFDEIYRIFQEIGIIHVKELIHT